MLEETAGDVLVALEQMRQGEAMEPRITEIHRLLLDHLKIDLESKTEITEVVRISLVSGFGVPEIDDASPPSLLFAFTIQSVRKK